jgi:hypothetical protein
MNESQSPRNVVVADIRMPFWSMVVFMVKWAIAAIPALLLLAIIGFGITVLSMALLASIRSSKHSSDTLPTPSYSSRPAPAKQEPYAPNVPDRCKGSTEIEKCVDEEQRWSQETPEQRAKSQADLEAARKASMAKVK